MTILGHIKDGDRSSYRKLVNNIIVYGQDNLVLNTDKTKELDFGGDPILCSLSPARGKVEPVDSFSFLTSFQAFTSL